jgi:small GTP-binding protein
MSVLAYIARQQNKRAKMSRDDLAESPSSIHIPRSGLRRSCWSGIFRRAHGRSQIPVPDNTSGDEEYDDSDSDDEEKRIVYQAAIIRQRAAEARRRLAYRVVIVGDAGAGRSTLLQALTESKAVASPSSSCQSGVLDMRQVRLDDDRRIQFWDVGSQTGDRYNGILSTYYRSARKILLVFDGSIKEGFKSIPVWIERLTLANVQLRGRLVIVCSKADLPQDAVSQEAARRYAAEAGASVHDVSSITSQGIDDLFESVLQEDENAAMDSSIKEAMTAVKLAPSRSIYKDVHRERTCNIG